MCDALQIAGRGDTVKNVLQQHSRNLRCASPSFQTGNRGGPRLIQNVHSTGTDMFSPTSLHFDAWALIVRTKLCLTVRSPKYLTMGCRGTGGRMRRRGSCCQRELVYRHDCYCGCCCSSCYCCCIFGYYYHHSYHHYYHFYTSN